MFETTTTSRIIGLVDGNVLSLCPTMDLIVLSMNKMSIWVFRLNGERIYSINNKAVILDLTWSPDGKFFCLSGVDGYCKVYDTNNGDLVNLFEVSHPIELINWSSDMGQELEQAPDQLEQGPDQDHDMDQEQPSTTKAAPQELFAVNILDHLPITSDFADFKHLNYLLVSSHDQLSIIFNNLVKITYKNSFKLIKNFNVNLFNQYYISESDNTYQLVKLSIPYEENIPKILLIFCKMKLIITNIKKNLVHLSSELVMFYNVFDRYLSNYYDNLNSSDETVPVTAKHESVIKSFSGILISHLIPNNLTDYWLSQLGDRGYKRLEKLGNNNYDLVRNIIYKHLINSLEKLLLLMTELKTIVDFSILPDSGNQAFNITEKDITQCIHNTKEFIKELYNFIWDCNEEQKLFNQFLSWVKFLIDTLNKYNNDDDINLPVKFDYIQLLNYFNFNLFQSKIFNYLKLSLNTEILLNSTETDLISLFDENIDNLVNQQMKNFEGYINSITTLNPLPLVNVNSDCEFISVNGLKLLITIEKSAVTIIEIKSDHELLETTLDLAKPIANYKIFNDQLIVLVNVNEEYYLESYDILELMNQTQNVRDPRYLTKLTQNPKYLFINQKKNYGCLLDSNKKDYSIFQL